MINMSNIAYDKLQNLNIVIYTRYFHKSLYSSSCSQLAQLPFRRIRLRCTTADGYFYKLLYSKADIAINIDEDAFLIDNQKLLDLIVYMIENNYANCGFPDGGALPVRFHNPLITNPFFNILDLRQIKNKFSHQNIKQYKQFHSEYMANAPLHLLKYPYQYDMYEPFYPFFLWISQNFKVLYLEGIQHADGITTILNNQEGKPFLVHTWFSRLYHKDKFHTDRINSVLAEYKIKSPATDNIIEQQMIIWCTFIKEFIKRMFDKFNITNHI